MFEEHFMKKTIENNVMYVEFYEYKSGTKEAQQAAEIEKQLIEEAKKNHYIVISNYWVEYDFYTSEQTRARNIVNGHHY